MDVLRVGATVETGGAVRDVVRASVVREVPSTGPGSLGVPGGFYAASADVTFKELDDPVEVGRVSPWDRTGGWPPVHGDSLRVDAVGGSTRFDGVVEDVTGSALGDVQVTGVDDFDRFNRRVVVEPVGERMPSDEFTVFETKNILQPRIRHEWYVDRALRAAGYRFGPEPAHEDALYVPLMGGLLPAGDRPHARIHTPYMDGDRLGRGEWVRAPWGLGWSLWGEDAYSVRRRTYRWAHNANSTSDFTCGITVARPAPGAPTGEFTLGPLIATNAMVQRIVVEVDHDECRINYMGPTGVGKLLGPLYVDWSGDSMDIVLQAYDGWSTFFVDGVDIGFVDTHFLAAHDTEMVGLYGHNATVGHLFAGTKVQTKTLLPRNATLHAGTMFTTELVAGRRVDTTALELLREILEATSSLMWITPEGHLHWAHPDGLTSPFGDPDPPVQLTSEADLLDLAWKQSIRDVRSKVTVKGQAADVVVARDAQHILWSGPGDTVPRENNRRYTHTATWWAEPEQNVEWFDIHLTQNVRNLRLGRDANVDFMELVGNWWGYLSWDSSQNETLHGRAHFAADRVTSQTYKVTHDAVFTGGDGVQQVGFRMPEDYFKKSSHPWALVFNEHPLPVIRGWGFVRWDDEPELTIGAGPEGAAEYTHDVGWWLQGPDRAKMAGWLASAVTRSRALIERLPIVPRYDIALGDVVEVLEDKVYGLAAKCLVVGVHETYADGDTSMLLTLRVLAVTTARSFTLDVDVLNGPKEI